MVIFNEPLCAPSCGNFGAELPEWVLPVVIVLLVWTFFWKGVSMWHAARRKDSTWFVILLIFNTLGILDMYYLFGVAKLKADKLLKK